LGVDSDGSWRRPRRRRDGPDQASGDGRLGRRTRAPGTGSANAVGRLPRHQPGPRFRRAWLLPGWRSWTVSSVSV